MKVYQILKTQLIAKLSNLFIREEARLAEAFEDEVPELVDELSAKEISLSKAYLTDIALKNKNLIYPMLKFYDKSKKFHDILSYIHKDEIQITEQMIKEPSKNFGDLCDKIKKENPNLAFSADNPYFGNYVDKLYDINAEDIVESEQLAETEWQKQRENGYKNATSAIYLENPVLDAKARKYPVIDNHSLSMFIHQTKHHIDQSHGAEEPKIDNKNFIQTMFADVNGKLKRYFRVIELTPTTQSYMNVQDVPTFDFAVSIKCSPDGTLKNAQNLIRLESKGQGNKAEAHRNELGTTDKEFYNDGNESYNHKMFNELYNSTLDFAHVHIFDEINQFINIGHPISCNAISLKHLVTLSKKEYNDDSGFSDTIKAIIEGVKDKQTRSILNQLITKLDVSYNELNSDRSAVVKKSWEDKWAALKLAIEFVDKIYNIADEKDKTIENVRQIIALGFSDEDLLNIDEQEEIIEFEKGWKDFYNLKRYNELIEKLENGEHLSAREMKLINNFKKIDAEGAEQRLENHKDILAQIKSQTYSKESPQFTDEEIEEKQMNNIRVQQEILEAKKETVERYIEKQNRGKILNRDARKMIKLYQRQQEQNTQEPTM